MNNISGIYLPFIIDNVFQPERLQPLFIVNHNNHYSELVPEHQSANYRIPIVDSFGKLLNLQFIDDDFATYNMKLCILKKYLCITESEKTLCASWPTEVLDVMKDRLPPYLISNGWTEMDTNIYSACSVLMKFPKCDCAQKENKNCLETCLNRLSFVEYSPKSCSFGESCANMTIQKSKPLKLMVFSTKSNGLGLKTENEIKSDQFIIEYVGDVVTMITYKTRLQTIYADKTDCYGMALGKELVIDSTAGGNISRFMNHSCDPNCTVEQWTVNGLPRMAIFAKRDIQSHEELTFDYRFQSFDDNVPQICNCGAKECRGYLSV